MGSFQDHLRKPVPECRSIVDFAAARDDGAGDDCNWNAKGTLHEHYKALSDT